MYRSLTILFFFFVANLSLNAQNSCEYQLILNDFGGEGWQNAEVTFFIETDPTPYILAGDTDTISISVIDGDSISLAYTPEGVANAENNIQLLDSDGQVLLNITDPSNVVLFEGFVSCPSCPAIVLNSVVNVDSFDNRILIDWEPSDSLGTYQVEYARCGFLDNPDSVSVVMASVSDATIPDLMENTCYEYQISLVCLSGEQSIASGPHKAQTIFTTDVGISGVFAPTFGSKCEYATQDTLFVFLKNYGAAPQSLVPFDFTISKGELAAPGSTVIMPDDGLFTGILVKDSCIAFPFESPIDIADPGEYTITTWTALGGDGDISNDTFVHTFSHSSLLPFFEDFTDNALPNRWTSDEPNPIIGGIVSSDLDPLNSRFTLETERYGYISDTDTLSFQYLFSELGSPNPAMLAVGDRLLIEASRDCGESYEVIDMIDMSNFDTSVMGLREHKVPLTSFVDDIISFRFSALRGGSSFTILLDDININECIGPDPLQLDFLTINTSQEMEANGSFIIRPQAGIGPYTFEFSTGFEEIGTQSGITNLAAGFYSVTVTDRFGCFDTQDISIGVVNTYDLADITELLIYPNPVSDILNVDITLDKAQDLQVRIYNVMGQEMWSNNVQTSQRHQMAISIQALNQGVYFLQLSSEAGQVTERFVVER